MTRVAAVRLAVSRGIGTLSARAAGSDDRVGERARTRIHQLERGDWLRFGVLAAAAVVLILVVTRNMSFTSDEYAYLYVRRIDLPGLLAPFHQHLVALHVLVYELLIDVFGTGSYLPFQVALMATHVALAAGLFALIEPYRGRTWALGAATLMLFLGSGYENLVWAFQIGFIGASALGVWALVAAPRRPGLAALLLTASLWTAGVGLFYVVPVWLLSRDRRWLILPIASYVAWYVLARPSPPPPLDPAAALAYAVVLVGSIAGGMLGVGRAIGYEVDVVAETIVGIAILAAAVLSIRRVDRLVAIGALGLLAEVVILSLGREDAGPAKAAVSRYVYVAAPFALMVLAGIGTLSRRGWAVVFAFALALNIATLQFGTILSERELAAEQTLTLQQRIDHAVGTPAQN